MENISLELMVHHSCQISDDEENIPAGIVRFDYSHSTGNTRLFGEKYIVIRDWVKYLQMYFYWKKLYKNMEIYI